MPFAETQFPDWRICALMLLALAGLLVWRRAPRLPACTAMVLLAAAFFECRLTTRVDEQALHIDFGLVPVYSRTIALADIVALESSDMPPVAASPAAGSWGWGLHRDRDGTFAIAIRGALGVLLTLRDGSKVRIGSQEPGTLEQALRQRMPAGA
jgi:hypothetical protein